MWDQIFSILEGARDEGSAWLALAGIDARAQEEIRFITVSLQDAKQHLELAERKGKSATGIHNAACQAQRTLEDLAVARKAWLPTARVQLVKVAIGDLRAIQVLFNGEIVKWGVLYTIEGLSRVEKNQSAHGDSLLALGKNMEGLSVSGRSNPGLTETEQTAWKKLAKFEYDVGKAAEARGDARYLKREELVRIAERVNLLVKGSPTKAQLVADLSKIDLAAQAKALAF